MCVVAATGAGVTAGQIVGPTAAMDWHRQAVFTEGDHAAAEPADGPLAPSAFLEIEPDENAQSEDQFANLLIGVLVLRERRQAVDRRHEGIDLLLGRHARLGCRLRCRLFRDLASNRGLLRDEAVELLGNGCIASVVLFGGHSPLGCRDVV